MSVFGKLTAESHRLDLELLQHSLLLLLPRRRRPRGCLLRQLLSTNVVILRSRVHLPPLLNRAQIRLQFLSVVRRQSVQLVVHLRTAVLNAATQRHP